MYDRDRIFELRPTLASEHPNSPERRRHPRHRLARACKLRLDGAVRYEPASTVDVSAGGARLYLDSDRPVEPGQPIEIAIAWDAQPTLRSGETVRGTVVRADEAGESERRTIAVRFERPIGLALSIPPGRAA